MKNKREIKRKKNRDDSEEEENGTGIVGALLVGAALRQGIQN